MCDTCIIENQIGQNKEIQTSYDYSKTYFQKERLF